VEWQAAPPATTPPPPRPTIAPAHLAPIAAQAAAAQGLPPALLEALVWQESRWHPQAISPKGAIGLGQLMPATARSLGVDPHDPEANLHGAARYLRQQIDHFGGNLPLGLAAYNAGPKRVEQAGGIPPIAETQAYVRAITQRFQLSTATGATTP
jgi:soluble lytic murein transglycosylase-like protein